MASLVGAPAKEKLRAGKKVEEEKKSGLKVNLPSGAAQEIDLSKKSLIVVIGASGEVAINGEVLTDEQLDQKLRKAFVDDKSTQVVLQADKGVPHGRVVNVMEHAKRVGLTRLAIGTTAQ